MATVEISISVPEEWLIAIDPEATKDEKSRQALCLKTLERAYWDAQAAAVQWDDPEPDEVEALDRAREEISRGETVSWAEVKRKLFSDSA